MSSSVVVVVLVLVLVVVVGGNVCLTVVVGFLALRFGDVDADIVFLGFDVEVLVVVALIGDARRMSPGSSAKKSESSSSSSLPVTRSRSNPGSAAYTVLSVMPRRATAYDVWKIDQRKRDVTWMSTRCKFH